MKTIVLGYKDIAGKGACELLKGTDVSIRDQALYITGIKAGGKYPEGCVRVEFAELIARNIAVSIDASIKAREADEAARAKREKSKDKADAAALKALEAEQARIDSARAERREAAAKADRAEKDAIRKRMS